MRRCLSGEHGEGLSEVRAAAWCDIKRVYVEHPSQWALYVATRRAEELLPICKNLGFRDTELSWQSEDTLQLEFGAAGIWSWLRRLASSTELGWNDCGSFGAIQGTPSFRASLPARGDPVRTRGLKRARHSAVRAG